MELIGQYYREKVLDAKGVKTETRELPNLKGKARIEKDLLGWRLQFSGDRFIKCRSEAEARYLKVFLEGGLTEVEVPCDEEYLKSILPRLEKLKAATEEILNEYLEGIVTRKKRHALASSVWGDVMCYETADTQV